MHLHWQASPVNYLKINVDASFHPNFYLAGIGVLIRNHARRFLAAKGTLRRTQHANQAKA